MFLKQVNIRIQVKIGSTKENKRVWTK